jgi:hypothetical protein
VRPSPRACWRASSSATDLYYRLNVFPLADLPPAAPPAPAPTDAAVTLAEAEREHILYAKGQEWDWFGDPFWRVQIFFATMVINAPEVDKTETRDSRSWTEGQICEPAAGRIKRAVTLETLSIYPGFEISFFHSGSWPNEFQFFFAS